MFDWATCSFYSIIMTFVFSSYFSESVAPNKTAGTEYWGYMISISGLIVLILSPILGAISDKGRNIKPWLIIFWIICCLFTSLLFFVSPHSSWTLPGLIIVAVALIAYEFMQIFYNSLLIKITSKDKIGKVSNLGFAAGYFGGIICLFISLYLIKGSLLQTFDDINIRSTFIFVSVWMIIFSLPLLLFTKDMNRTCTNEPFLKMTKDGIFQLAHTVINTKKKYLTVAKFLLVKFLYIDALNTLFAFGGIYAHGTFNFTFTQIILFAIIINLCAGLGALIFAQLDKYIGSKKIICYSLIGLLVSSSVILVTHSYLVLYISGAVIGIFAGPLQASSRSYMINISPKEQISEMFGLYSLSGKISNICGAFLVSLLMSIFANQRIALSVIPIFFIIGFALMLRMPYKNREGKYL